MSRDSRFDQLEQQILAGLRAADGPEPSISMDQRIRAQAHAAVAKPASASTPRKQPRWMSIAAGVVVLVGTGLAIRVSEQAAREPNVLDAPQNSESAKAPTQIQQEATRDELGLGGLRSSSKAPLAAKPAKIPNDEGRGRAEVSRARESAMPTPAPALKSRVTPNAFPLADEARSSESQRLEAPAQIDSAPAPIVAAPSVAAPSVEGKPIAETLSEVAKQPTHRASEVPIGEADALAVDNAPPADTGFARSPAAPPAPSASTAGMLSEQDDAPATAGNRSDAESRSTLPSERAAIPYSESAAPGMAGVRQQADARKQEPKKRDEVSARLSLEDAIEHVRAILAAGDRAQAIVEAKALRNAFPQALLPKDVQQLLDE